VLFDGGDVVGFHGYAGQLAVDLTEGHVGADLSWRYEHSPVPVDLRVFRSISPRQDLFVAGEQREWIEEVHGAEIGVSYGLPALEAGQALSASYAMSYVDQAAEFAGRLDPNDPPPQLPTRGRLATLRFGWSYSDVERATFDVSSSTGQSAGVGLSIADPKIGSRFQTVTVTWSAAKYIANPWLDHHVLALRYGGGLSDGQIGRRPVFSVGGFPDASIVDGLIDNAVLGGVALRGYSPFFHSGSQFHLLQVEYRLPLVRLRQGLSSLPVFAERLWFAAFADYGDAFSDRFDLDSFLLGVGGQLLFDFRIGYTMPFTLRLGLARGLNDGGETQPYMNLGFAF
jgi:hypothetical protein